MTEPGDALNRTLARSTVDRPVSVRAGAGTGKTTLLVDRVIDLIEQGHASLDALVIVTFTEKAAAELRARVRQKLELSRLTTGSARAGVALELLDGAHIETIHSFCARLLQEFAPEAGLEPGLRILDALQSELLARETWGQWLQDELARPRTPLARALDLDVKLADIKAFIQGADEQRWAAPFSPAPPADGPTAAAFFAEVSRVLALCLDLRDNGQPQADDGMPKHLATLVEAVDLVRLADEADLEAALRSLPKLSGRRIGNLQKWTHKGNLTEIRAQLDDLEAQRERYLGRVGSEVVHDLTALASAYVVYARRRRQELGVIDFDDLLIQARDLVVTHPLVRERLRRRFRYLLIDEFQDTDPAQAELLRVLAADDTDQLDGGKLFIVGDAKQSIYRFRRADLALYSGTQEAIRLARGLDLAISQNFRSVPGVLRWVNRVFGATFPAVGTPTQAAYEPIDPFADVDPPFPVVVVRPPASEPVPGRPVARARRQEARALAGVIASAGGNWLVRDRGSNQLRQARWGDLAVLVPTRAVLPDLVHALDQREVPYVQESASGFFQQDDVNDLINLLRAIDTPFDRLTVVAALRSAAFACSDADLYAWSREGRGWDYRRPIVDDGHRVGSALDMLRRLHHERLDHPLAVFVRLVLQTTRLLVHWGARPAGLQHIANLERIADLARGYEERQTSSLTGLVRWLEERAAPLADAPDNGARIDIENLDAVRIMTIHAAKGLEFDVVFLLGLGTAVPWSGSSRLLVRDGVTEARLGPKKDGLASAGYEAIAADHDARETEERLRLLYVAATRARDRLVLSAFKLPDGQHGITTRLDPLWPFIESAGVPHGDERDGVLYLDAPALDDVRSSGPVVLERTLTTDLDRAVAAREAAVTSARRSIDAAVRPQQRVTASGLKLSDQDEPPPPVDLAVLRNAADRGELFHRSLELANFDDPAAVPALVNRLAAESGHAEWSEELTRLVLRFLSSDLGERARRAQRQWRELPFSFALDGVLVTGAMDLVLEEAGRLVVVDYKSDRRPAATDRYRLQAAVYALALEETTGRTPDEVLFFFAEHERTLAVAVDAALLALARQRISGGAGGWLQARFELA